MRVGNDRALQKYLDPEQRPAASNRAPDVTNGPYFLELILEETQKRNGFALREGRE
jgi:hypothetical protein